jgi:tRNA 2-thiouridine synthesizing protein A
MVKTYLPPSSTVDINLLPVWLQKASISFTEPASGLNCPLPILKTKKALSKMDAGKILDVISTDAGSVKDIEAFCNQTGNKLISTTEDGGKYIFTIERV